MVAKQFFPRPNYPHDSAIVDTGATDHFFAPNTQGLTNKQPNKKISVALPDGNPLTSQGTATMTNINLPQACKEVHILPGFTNSLFSVPKVCDHDHVAIFDKEEVKIYKQKKINVNLKPALTGQRNPQTKLWELEVPINRAN